jgi:hypothetical protein
LSTSNSIPALYSNPDVYLADSEIDDLELFSNRRKNKPAMEIVYAFAAEVMNTENVSVTIGGLGPATFMIDSGATYTILPSTTAQSIGFDTSNPTRQQAITTVTGQTQANVYSVQLKINDTPAFNTEILVMESAFNLLSTEDLAKAYNVTLAQGGRGFHLVPLDQVPSSTPTSTTQPQEQSIGSTGNVIMDALRQLYNMFCGMTPKIPIICNSPSMFMFFLAMIGFIFLLIIIRGLKP